jgi:hypothetical protein
MPTLSSRPASRDSLVSCRRLRDVRPLAILGLVASWLLSAAMVAAPPEKDAETQDKVLFGFEAEAAARDWAATKLPGLSAEQPAPKIEVVPAKKGLQLTFSAGDWPAIATAKIPVPGNWQSYQTLKADLTVDRPSVAYFRVCQGKPDDEGKQPCWQKTMILQPGLNEVTLMLRLGLGVLNPKNGDVTSFVIGMHRPVKDQTLLVANVRLSPDWPPPKVLGRYSPYNHDGYSSAAGRDYRRAGKLPKFKVLGTDREVVDLTELGKQLKDKWTKPEPKTIEQVEADFKDELAKIQKTHPKAVLALLREGDKGADPANPDKPYAGWKIAYLSCHGPDGPNRGREVTPKLGETVEVFARHRSVLMRADLASIPKDATILAARLAVTRSLQGNLKLPEKPNLWVAEPCNRDWDETAADCYCYAKGKHWKAVSGLYYGEDPDHWPVYLAHGPAGGGAVSAWDFTEAVKFWRDGKHVNHGFFLHVDTGDYMQMYTSRAKEMKHRPALMVIYEPKR